MSDKLLYRLTGFIFNIFFLGSAFWVAMWIVLPTKPLWWRISMFTIPPLALLWLWLVRKCYQRGLLASPPEDADE